MMEQYLRLKEEYPQSLLFFRLGDFYELFFQDAEIAARELQIALTSRQQNEDSKIPMCGVPYHSVQEYLSKLLEKRYKIAICDQVEDPKQAKGLVKRAVTRVLTPGTVVEETGLEDKTPNYLSACILDQNKDQGALAWIDFSTGQWSGLFSKKPQEIWQWLNKINPREILFPDKQPLPRECLELEDRITKLPLSGYFDWSRAKEKILEIHGGSSLAPLDLEDKPQLVQACGAIITYVRQTQKNDLSHLESFRPLNIGQHLILDEVTERNLELFQRLDGGKGQGTLWQVLDFTKTPMGGRLLKTRIKQPWRELKPIQKQQEVVEYFYQSSQLLSKIRNFLDNVFDLQRLSTRIALNRCTPKDLISLRNSLEFLPEIYAQLNQFPENSEIPSNLSDILKNWDNLQDIYELLKKSLVDNPPALITEGGLFQSGYDPDLDQLLELTEHGEAKIKELLSKERSQNDLPKLKLGFNRVFGYYFELSKAHKGPIPEHFQRRQTLANSERYMTSELKDLEEKIFSASEKRKSLEYDLFQSLRNNITKERNRIVSMSEIIGELDYWQCLAQAAQKWEWTKPELHSDLDIIIEQGRHPAVEAVQGRNNYIPNDLTLDSKGKILLITGPNMAGKSTVLRQAAIICILAQLGSFVPAQKAKIGLSDRIFTRVGASDNLAYGQSTFMVEMTEAARILRQAGKKSLIILDEIGRGTSTFDGLSLAWAVVENLANKGKEGIRTLFATHYHELTELEGHLPGVRNYNIAVKEWKGDIVFLRRMVPGPADRSYGIEVAKLAGVPKTVIQRAREILSDLEKKSEALKKKKKSSSQDRLSLLPGVFKQEKITSPGSNTEPQPQDHPLLIELKNLNIESLSPLEALNLLNRWQEKWGG